MSRNKRDRWRPDVTRAKRLPSSTRLFLSSVLANYMRADGHVSRPRDFLARQMGCDIRTIDRHFTRAVEAGWLVHVRGGYLGHTAEYEASWPDAANGSMRDTNVAHMSDRNRRASTGQSVAHMRDKTVAPSSTSGTTTAASNLAALDDDFDTAHRRDVLALENERNSNPKRLGRNHLQAVPA